jgi:glucose/arabinose dehydrogenase
MTKIRIGGTLLRLGSVKAVRALALAAASLALIGCGFGSGLDAGDQQRSPSIAGRSAARLVPFVRGLAAPVGIASAKGDPRLYVVEQGGTIRIIERGRLLPGFMLDLRGRVSTGGEQGLLGLAFHPNYRTNRRFYVNYTDRNGDTRVVEYRSRGLRAIASSARQVLFVDQPYSNHNGGHVLFGPDGLLYVGLGDGGAGGDPEDRAQDMSSLLGKMLRIDVNRRGARPEIVALGLRNPWRYSFDRRTGDLYIGDVGQGNLEEIDFTPRNSPGLENYGWDLFEGRSRFEDTTQGPGDLVGPIAQYGRDGGHCSVTGGVVYRGTRVPAFAGRYLYADYCSGTFWSLKVLGGQATGLRRESFRVENPTSFGEDSAGEVYVTSHGGTVYRLAR